MMSVSSQYLASLTIAPIAQAKAALAQAEVEETTGQHADLGLALGAQAGAELSLRNQVGALQTMTSDNSLLSTNLQVAQGALTSIASDAQNVLQSLAAWTSGDNSSATLANLGANALQSLTAAANTTSGGAYVFAGINSAVAPMGQDADFASPASTAVAAAFTATFGFAPDDSAASSITASQMQSFLDGPFAALFNDSGWSANWSTASSQHATATIAPGETIDASLDANAPAFRDLSRAYAMLGAFGGGALSDAAR